MLQMENMVSGVIWGKLMENDRTVGGWNLVGGNVQAFHTAEYAIYVRTVSLMDTILRIPVLPFI